MADIVSTPKPPYYAVIFTSVRTTDDTDYGETLERMVELAHDQPGFLGLESVRDPDSRFGLTVVYWKSLEAIEQWGNHTEHVAAQKKGRQSWYEKYKLRVSRVESDREFVRRD